MITTIKENTLVEFAKTKQGTIAIDVPAGMDNYQVILRQTFGKTEVGKPIEDKSDIQELPKIVLDFYRVESVETLIAALEVIKRRFYTPNYALAC